MWLTCRFTIKHPDLEMVGEGAKILSPLIKLIGSVNTGPEGVETLVVVDHIPRNGDAEGRHRTADVEAHVFDAGTNPSV